MCCKHTYEMSCISEYMNGKHECNLLIFVFVLPCSRHNTQTLAWSAPHTNECQPNATSSSFLTLVHFLCCYDLEEMFVYFFALVSLSLSLVLLNSMLFMSSMLRWQCVTFAWFHINSFKSNEISEMHYGKHRPQRKEKVNEMYQKATFLAFHQ